jgi:hypothetical protein
MIGRRRGPAIHLHRTDGGIETVGLAASQSNELVVRVTPGLVDEARALLERTVAYALDSGRKLASGETMTVGSWLVRFTEVRQGTLALWEVDSGGDEFVAGVERTLTLWRDQNRVCAAVGAEFDPPLYDRMAIVSDGVLDGDPAEGVRYPSPDHMSGWWLTTDRFNGDPGTLGGEHVHRVCSARPDLGDYLALPPGWRFDTRSGSAWFDQVVADNAEAER